MKWISFKEKRPIGPCVDIMVWDRIMKFPISASWIMDSNSSDPRIFIHRDNRSEALKGVHAERYTHWFEIQGIGEPG
jgi:hypothetical protein